MTEAGGRRRLAIAASLALHAGVLALLWQLPPPAPHLLQTTSMQLTLQAPSASRLATDTFATALPASSFSSPPVKDDSVAAAVAAATGDGVATPADSRPSPAMAIVDSLARGTNTSDTDPQAPGPESGTEDARADAAAVDAGTMADSAGTSSSAGSTPAQPSYTSGQVMASVGQAFSAHFYYPALARRKGWEGKVTLAVRVESDGRLTGIHVVGSSGYRVLDHAAMDSLLRAHAVPLPGGALVDGLDMVLPVQYRLFDARV
jgi:protein TonB